MNAYKSLTISVLTFLLLLLGVDVFLRMSVPGKFLPAKKMKEAKAMGQSCIVFAGNSRMVSAFKKDILESGLGNCVADVSVGSLDIIGITVTLREYLRTQNPKYVVLGFSGDMLLADEKTINPHEQIGNKIVLFPWGQFSDSNIHYPHLTVDNFSNYFTYIYFLHSSLAHYISIFWIKTQQLQDKLTGKAQVASNEFGNIEDMIKLGETFTTNSLATFNRYKDENKPWMHHPWFMVLRNLLKERNVPLVVVEIPMPSHFKKSVQTLESYQQYRDWLKQDGITFIDSDRFESIPDDQFKDRLHFNEEGGNSFSRQLAEILK